MTLPGPIRETRLQAVCHKLTEMAQRLGPEAKLPTIRELAEQLPTSVATLNLALQELEIRGLIVRKHGVGIFVASHLPRRRIALLCRPDFFREVGASPFWGLLLEHAQHLAETHPAELQFFFADEKMPLGTEVLPHFHGAIGIGLPYCVAQTLEQNGLPFVAFAGPATHTVGFEGAVLRAQGWAALRSLGCQEIAEIPDTLPSLTKQHAGYLWGKQLFAQARSQWPEGVLSCNDRLTVGFLGAVHEARVALGTTIALATHSNQGSPTLIGWESEIVRLEVSPEEIVTKLFESLEAQIQGVDVAPQTRQITIRTHVGENLTPLFQKEQTA